MGIMPAKKEVSMRELDRDRALARVGGDATLLSELAGLFLEEYPRLFETMRAGVEAEDPSAIISAAHQLKGLFGQFGAEAARTIALNVEMAARAGDLPAVSGLLHELHLSLNRMEPELREMAAC
jgi:HPt (histidine-containing phosphotransfer) domain-containing protein